MDCSLSGSSVHGIFQARVLEWGAIAFFAERANSLEKILMLGKTEGRRKRGRQRKRWLDVITDLMNMSLSELREMMMHREASQQGSLQGEQ